MPNQFNQQIIDEFRANNGQLGGQFQGARMLLLTTTGARSGAPHTTPLGYLPDGGERRLVIGSAGGGPKHPDWFHNLLTEPRVTVEDGLFVYPARAVVLHGAERDDAFARAADADPGWADYQAGTVRVIPVVALEAIPGPPRFADAATSPGTALKLIHDAFRRELALIRTEVTAAGTGLGAQLRVNCLTVCAGLHGHHTREDDGLFPHLADRHPQLRPALERLRREHATVATLLGDLQAVLAADDADPDRVLGEVVRLTDALSAHLTYEEEELIPVLDAAGTRG